jgi:predicted PurR-regulated permease PerM
METPIYNLDLSWKTIVRVLFAVGVVFLLFNLKNILISLLFAFVLAIILKSAIVFFYRFGIPYWVSAILTYTLIFGLFGLLLYLSVPLVFMEIGNAVNLLPEYLSEISPFLSKLGLDISEIGSWAQEALLPKSPENVFQSISSFMGGLTSTFFVVLMALFISLERKGIESLINFLTPTKHQSKVIKAWTRSRKQVTQWFGSRVICALFVLAAYFLTYQIFGVGAAFVLALIAGIANFIPYVGSLVAALLAGLVIGLQLGWPTAFIVLIILFFIQAIESYILGPLLTRKMTGLPPYLILLALAIGGNFFGLVGAFLAIPMTAIVYQFVLDLKGGEYQSEGLIQETAD